MIPIASHRRDRQRGQGLVEFALILPIVLVVLVSVAELGFVFGKTNSLGYATREGARTGAALADGGDVCELDGGDDPAEVDNAIISAVQRILKSPDSGIDMARVEEIEIFSATDTGAVEGTLYNTWHYAPGGGPKVDEVDDTEVFLDFRQDRYVWRACADRTNDIDDPDSIGITIRYRYEFLTPLPSLINALADGALELVLEETTVMALNPTALSLGAP